MNEFVNWQALLPSSAHVVFSTLAVPDYERSSLNRDVAEIELASGYTIDVAWCENDEEYVVTLYRDNIEESISQPTYESVNDVVEAVIALAQQYGTTKETSIRSEVNTSEVYTFRSA